MLDQIKKLKVTAMKAGKKLEVDAYNAVISSVQTAQGRGVKITQPYIMDAIKREIKIYKEVESSDDNYIKESSLKAEILEKLLPVQLTVADLEKLFEENKESVNNPKEFMALLEELGFTGQFNKGDAAKIVLRK